MRPPAVRVRTVTVSEHAHAGRSEQSGPATRRIGDRELMTMLSAIMALTALAIDLLLPAFDEIRASFGISDQSNQVSQVITVFFFGLAVSQLVWGPLADRFGRKPILYVGIAVYVAGAVGSALAPGLLWLLLFRFLWGVGAAGARVIATAIVRDAFEGTRMAEAMSQIMAVFVLVPVIAPAIGSGIIALLPWRSIFWFCVIWAGLVVLWSRRLPETLDPRHRRPLQFRSVVAGFGYVARNRTTAYYTLTTLFLQGVFISYIGSSERIISEVFDREDQFPYIFGAVAVLFGAGALINGRIVGRIGITRLVHIALGLVLVLSVTLLGMTLLSDGQPEFWIFMPLLGLMLGLFMLLMPNLNTAALEPMGELAGTASSVTGAARIAGGSVLGGVVNTVIDDTVTPFVAAVVVFVCLAIVSTWWAERGAAAVLSA
jgi:DHA1 family bicyclomycin/chloramphenicol resistance-like MFS transporter